MTEENDHRRLSDFVFKALRIALDQQDLEIAELLTRALEQSMTRYAGGPGFAERREFSEEFEKALVELQDLRKSTAS